MAGADLLRAVEVGDGAGHAQDAVVAAGGEAHAVEGAAHQRLSFPAQAAEAAQLLAVHAGVGHGAVVPEALSLDGAGGVDALFDLRRALGRGLAAQLVILQRRDLHNQVDPVQQRAGDTAVVAAHLLRRAAAAARGVPVPAALAGVHRAHQHEAGREGHRPRDAGDRHLPVLHGLAQHLQHVRAKLRQLVEKEDRVVGQADLSRLGEGPAAGQRRGGHRVVRRAEGPRGDDGTAAARKPCHRPDLGGLDHLLPAHVRQDAGQTLGHHGLARPRRADEQDVVPARGGDLQRTLDVLLTLHIREIRQRQLLGVHVRHRRGFDRLLASQMPDELRDALHRNNLHVLGKGGLRRVLRRDEEASDPLAPGGDGHRQRAGDGPQLPRQGKLAQEGAVRRRGLDLTACREDPDQHGQIIERADLFLVRGGEIHGHAADREAEAVVFHRRPHALTRFLDRRIRQTDDVKGGQAVGDIDLHRHRVAADAADAEGCDLRVHTITLLC